MIYIPSSHTIHTDSPTSIPTPDNRSFCKVRILSYLVSFLLANGVGDEHWTIAFPEDMLHFPCNQQQQNPDILYVRSTHKLQRKKLKQVV